MAIVSSDSHAGHVAIFLPDLGCGGAERSMVALANGLSAQGARVDLVLATGGGVLEDEVAAGVGVVHLHARRVLTATPALANYLRVAKPGCLLSALDHANVVAVLARALARSHARLVVSVRDTVSVQTRVSGGFKDRGVPLAARIAYRYADCITAVSSGVADDLASVARIPRSKVEVAYNPVITDEFLALAQAQVEHPWFGPDQPPVVLGVGRLVKQKGFETLLKAFATARQESDMRLVILGEGDHREALQALAEELAVAGSFDMPGHIANPFPYMREAAVFVLSSLHEGLPGVLIQAMACGAPVVATDCPNGPDEILERGKWGALIPMEDPTAMARAIVTAINRPRVPYPEEALYRFTAANALQRYSRLLGVAGEHF